MKFVFGMQIKSKVFYKVLLSSWVRVTRHAQSTQNKLVYLCIIYFQESLQDEVEFWPAYKHKSFQQVHSITSGVCIQTCPKYSKQKFRISLQYLLPSKNFFKMILSLQMCMQSGMPKLHKITSLLFFYNIFSKKITTYLVSHLSLSSIIFSISALINDIFHCLNCISLFLHLIITHLVNIFYNNYVINICPRQLL